jgi:acetate kinase
VRHGWTGRFAVDGDMEITAEGARVRTIVIHAREDLEIARQTRGVLGDEPGDSS